MKYKIVFILVIFSIFSGCIDSPDNKDDLIKIDSGIVNKKVNIDNLEIVALDYEVYGIKNIDTIIKILKINFSVTNIDTNNKIKPIPNNFILKLKDEDTLIENVPIEELKKLGLNIILLDMPPKSLIPGYSININKLFRVPTNFDIKSTKIAVISGDTIKPFE